jgi:hypothetical protein
MAAFVRETLATALNLSTYAGDIVNLSAAIVNLGRLADHASLAHGELDTGYVWSVVRPGMVGLIANKPR